MAGMTAMVESSQPSGRLPAALGVASVVLLAAAFRWAHHWGPVADLIVAGWALSTLAGLVLSLRATSGPGRRAALFGLALTGVSVSALIITGIAMAAGADPAAGCGGG
jgi:hypothetical protein